MGNKTSSKLVQCACPSGHALRPALRSFKCDICSITVSKPSVSLFCSTCDYDSCPDHVIPGATRNVDGTASLPIKCPKANHPLSLTCRPAWICDICNVQHEAGDISAHCPPCNYDECVEHRLVSLPIAIGLDATLATPEQIKTAKMNQLLQSIRKNAIPTYVPTRKDTGESTATVIGVESPSVNRSIPAGEVLWGQMWGGISSDMWTKPSVYDAPYVSILNDPQAAAVRVKACDVELEVNSLLARCTMTLTFFNEHSRPLEGEVTIPLPTDAVITGYALEVNGEMVPASLLESKEAEKIYEAEVKKGVDPGLMQKVAAGGNLFKTRVYPLPANGSRRVSLTYVQPLEALDAAHGAFSLSIGFKAPAAVSVRGHVVSALRPITQGFAISGEFSVSQESSSNAYLVSYANKEHSNSDAALRVVVPLPHPDAPTIVVERAADARGGWYFAISDVAPTAWALPLTKHRTAVVWDASLSRQDSGTVAEERVILQKILQQDPATVIDIFVVRNVVEAVLDCSIGSAMEYLEQVLFDGATSLHHLEAELGPHLHKYDRVLLFSDGMSTIGDGRCAAIENGDAPPVYCIVSGTGAYNMGQLQHYWAGYTGGAVLSLASLSSQEVVEASATIAPRILGVAGAAVDCNPQKPQSVSGSRFLVTGRIPSEATQQGGTVVNVIIQVSYGGAVERRHYDVDLGNVRDSTTSGLLQTMWAQLRVSTLEVFPEQNSSEILALGRKHNIVTASTSLLVLETLAQHVEHGVVPHPERKVLFKQFEEHVAKKRVTEETRVNNKLKQVAGYWKRRVDWHKVDFKHIPEAEKPQKKEASRSMMMDDECAMESRVERCLNARSRCAAPSSARSNRECSAMADVSVPLSGASGAAPAACGATASVKYWSPDTPYLSAIRAATDTNEQYRVYIAQRKEYSKTPAFYFDVGGHFLHPEHITPERRVLGLRILSNIAELGLDNSRILRVLGYKLHEAKEYALASEVFCRVAQWRPAEPQSYRDLGLTLLERGWYQQSLDLLWQTITMEVPHSFSEIEVEALWELRDCLVRAQASNVRLQLPAELRKREGDFLSGEMSLDLRVTMGWDQDNVDIDLHVIEPTGEEAYYGHKDTRIGGLMSRDFTQGYGPESYVLKKAVTGTYRFRTNYYASHSPQLTGPTVAILTISTNFLRPEQKTVCTLIRLSEAKDNGEIGSVAIQ